MFYNDFVKVNYIDSCYALCEWVDIYFAGVSETRYYYVSPTNKFFLFVAPTYHIEISQSKHIGRSNAMGLTWEEAPQRETRIGSIYNY